MSISSSESESISGDDKTEVDSDSDEEINIPRYKAIKRKFEEAAYRAAGSSDHVLIESFCRHTGGNSLPSAFPPPSLLSSDILNARTYLPMIGAAHTVSYTAPSPITTAIAQTAHRTPRTERV
jgi:hypothetical protein